MTLDGQRVDETPRRCVLLPKNPMTRAAIARIVGLARRSVTTGCFLVPQLKPR